MLQVAVKGWRKRVQPMHVGEKILEGLARLRVLDPQRNDHPLLADGALDLLADLRRQVRLGREHQQEHAALPDGTHDVCCVFARTDIARGNPAADSRSLQHLAGGIGRLLVLVRAADKDVVSHVYSPGPPTRQPRRRSRGYGWL